jgi:hypothetical protein
MEKFNLERALAGEPVCTRDGNEVTQLTYFQETDDLFIVGGVLERELYLWQTNGRFLETKEHPKDLFMKPKENAIWVNVHSKDSRIWIVEGDDDGFKTEQEAKRYSFGDIYYIKTLRITDNRDTI